jgi:hypothetical protein
MVTLKDMALTEIDVRCEIICPAMVGVMWEWIRPSFEFQLCSHLYKARRWIQRKRAIAVRA